MVQAITVKRKGVQGLAFVVYVYDDHAVVSITRRDYAPLCGVDRRIGSVRVPVGRTGLTGLSPWAAVHTVAEAIARATDSAPSA